MSTRPKSIDKFTDADFIAWADHPIWTPLEAITALYGFKPKQSYTIQGLIDLANTMEVQRLRFNEEILETRFPTQDGEIETSEAERSWTLLSSFPRYDDISDEFKSPAKWVQRASYGGLKIVQEWQVVFPYSFKVTIGVSLKQEPDYRNFIDFLTRDVELPLKDLVCYGLNIHPDRFQQTPDCGDLLANIYSELRNEIDVSDIEELRDKKMPASSFLDLCQRYNHSLHAKCVGWSSWIAQHTDLRNHLSGNTRPSSAKTRESKVNFAIQSVINEILPQLLGQIAAGLADYLRDNGADHSEPGSTGVVLAGEGRYEIYLDGQTLVCIDRDDSDRRHERKLSSLDRYFKRAKQNSKSR